MSDYHKSSLEFDPLAYDNDSISPEQRVLTVIDWLFERKDQAVARLKRYGLPSAAIYDWIMECTLVAHNYLSNPLNRDCCKPPEDWNIIAVIPARGGSKGVPLKALRLVEGKTLLQRAIEACRDIQYIKRIIVNTDHPEIAAHAVAYGAEVPFIRPEELAGDESSLDEAVQFVRYWMALIEKQCYDFLIVMSSVTPLLGSQEVNGAMKRLSTSMCSSMQPVAALPSCSLDFLKMDAEGFMRPFLYAALPDPDSIAMQFGPFSIYCFRPYYQIQPWFRPHVYELAAPPDASLAHLLPAQQGLEIDELWDLDACIMLLQDDSTVRFSTDDQPVTFHEADFLDGLSHGETVCLVYLPPRDQRLEVEGLANHERVVSVLREAGMQHVAFWCHASEPGELGLISGSPLLGVASPEMPEDAPHNGGTARPEIAEILRRCLPLLQDVSLMLIDGRAGMLRATSIRRIMEKMAAHPGETIVSVSPPVVHPYYLKHIRKDGTVVPAIKGDAYSRHDLPELYCRDGVLCFIPVKVSSGKRGVCIPPAEGRVLRNVFDGVRALVLAKHTENRVTLKK